MTHTVTFVAEGVTVKTMTVDDGYVLKNSDYPTVPAKAGYIGSWNKYTGPITSNRTIQAFYRLPNRCVVTFKVENRVLKTMTVDEGYVLSPLDYPSIPSKPNYHSFWSYHRGPITADTIVTGVYVPDDGPDITIPPMPTTPPDIEVASAGDEEESQAVEDTAFATGASTAVTKQVSTATERHDYVYASGRLLRETITTTEADGTVSTTVLDFAYDAQGTPYSLTYTNGTASPAVYYYITNLQGDVMYLINNSGTKVASYSYDPYGKITYATGTMAQINSLRYRGYYYDNESSFYYLQSRYYDAAICRFINADTYAVSSREFTGYNMFAYCGNNPASRTDSGGDSWWGWVAAAVVVAVCAVAVVATAGGAAAAVTAVTAVANGCAATTAASTVAAGAFIGSSVALAGTALVAAEESESWDEFASYGESAFFNTAVGAVYGGLEAKSLKPEPGNCFVAGTLVAVENGNIPIEEVEPGDYVWAWDEETGDVALKQVVETYVNETEELVHLSVNGEEITCTPGHPFYSPVKGWTEAVHLRAGDILVLVNGEYVVVEWVQHELLERSVKVYNLQVADYHTYYVASCGILVHNKCKPTSPNQMQKQVERNQAPNGVDRVDPPHVLGQQPHVHFTDGTSINMDGTIHDQVHGIPTITKGIAKWLKQNGWASTIQLK